MSQSISFFDSIPFKSLRLIFTDFKRHSVDGAEKNKRLKVNVFAMSRLYQLYLYKYECDGD